MKMKIFVKTLKGTHFDIDVKPDDTVADVKKQIETVQGPDVYPSAQQMLIHQGKVLKDPTTMSENNVLENNFLVIMLSKPKVTSSEASTTAAATTSQAQPPSFITPASMTVSAISETQTMVPEPSAVSPATAAIAAPTSATSSELDVYGQVASNLVAGSNFEEVIQHILDIGGGTWDRETVVHALRAAYNNPERAVEYLYSGIPDHAEVPPVARAPSGEQTGTLILPQPQQTGAPAAFASSGPNANPLDLFPQGLPPVSSNVGAGTLDFLRNSPQFRALQAMVQSNPQILQPMLQELGKQNPHLTRLIREHQSDFLRLINEPSGATEGEAEADASEISGSASEIPQAVTVTPEEGEAIERLEAMGFERALVLEVFFACNKNEELAANYLLDHMNGFED